MSEIFERYFQDTEKLLRCGVVNREGEASVRFVELDKFLLWRYVMCHKHGLEIEDLSLCLWMDEAQFESNDELFAHAGELERVDRVMVVVFDEQNRYSHAVSRYSLESDTEQMKRILRSHMPESLLKSDRVEMAVRSGYCVERQKTSDANQFVLGVSSA